jgi:hypothetical protein
MEERTGKLRVLVVQMWTHDVRPIRDALAAAGVDPAITRVDFEASLHAAFAGEPYALVIFDPTTTTLSQSVVAECVHTYQRTTPVIVADDLGALGDRARAVLRARSS